MPDFIYRAKDGPEKVVEGVLDANSEAAAIEKINHMGFVPIMVRPVQLETPKTRSQIFFQTAKHRRRQVIYLSRYLASFLKSGVSLLRGLQIMAEQEPDPAFRQILTLLVSEVQSGKNLSQGFERYPKYFSQMYVSVIRSGEQSGTLQESLTKMSDYLKKQDQLMGRLSQAMTYPLVLCVAGLATICYVLTFVVPKLAAVFTSTGQALPLPTQIVIALGDFMSKFGWILIIVLAALLLVVRQYMQREKGRALVDQLKLNAPFFKGLVFKAAFARFSRSLQMSVANGIPFLDALRISIPTMDNVVMKQALSDCYEHVQKGDSFGQRLRRVTLVPPFVANLVIVGEESGRLDEVLAEIAETYERENDETMHVLTTLLEPLMVFVVGSVVGFIVIALLLPVFEMNMTIQ